LARNYKHDIAPGKNTAILVVNGKQTQLSDAKTGIVVNNDIKYNDGTQVGSSALGMTEGDSRTLEVITPKGGTYFIILQDGTKVWLNADSKLEVLPNFWNKTQRLVKLTGEAYFEVAKVLSPAGRDGRRPERVPFLVESQGQKVEVLGTHFNISAYAGEVIKTTLLEGSVRIEGKLMLKPGQQSEISLNRRVTVKNVDAAEVTAWKDGKFVFNSDDMNGLMRQVARWYNVEVVYQDNVQDVKLTGSVSRFANISTLLDKLGQTGSVKFKLDGRTVTVMKAK
jgi:ferric-dicitrate binding protein FerR (iron transport regulator)